MEINMAGKVTYTMIPQSTQEALVKYLATVSSAFTSNWSIRERLEEVDRLYAREADMTANNRKAKVANIYGNSDAIQNIEVPVVMPQVEAAVTYQTSVFLSGNPIFGVVSDPENIDAAMQMETKIDADAVKGGWTSQLIKTLRDGFKYNLAAVEAIWDIEKVPAIETTINGTKPSTIQWAGNKVRHLDLYNTFWDNRVKPSDIAMYGEYAGYRENISRTVLKSFINGNKDIILPNIRAAFEAPTLANVHIPQINLNYGATPNNLNGTNWLQWANMPTTDTSPIRYKDNYTRTVLYARIIPHDIGLKVPAEKTPQIWKFVFINDTVLILAERQTNAHNLLPILFLQPYDDGLGYQTKSLANNVAPMQSVSSSLMNSVLAARRRAIYDRTVYDPSRIASRDMNSSNPISNIPVRPSAYGEDVRAAFAPFDYRDTQSSLVLGELGTISALADTITGQNRAQQGQFVKGNKTRKEFTDVMSNANSRSQVTSIAIEAQFFTPLKELIKLNILQYEGGTSLYNREAKQVVKIDPVALRKAVLEFKISDGLIPSEKLMNGETFSVALQTISSSPQIAAEYNLGDLMTYLFKSQGANVGDFRKPKEQIMYEQAMAAWQNAAMASAEKGVQFTQPQPLPKDYGVGAPKEQQQPKTILEQVMEQGKDETVSE